MNCFHYPEAQFQEDKEIQSRYAFYTLKWLLDQNICIFQTFSFLTCVPVIDNYIGEIRLQHIPVSGAMCASWWHGPEALSPVQLSPGSSLQTSVSGLGHAGLSPLALGTA